MPRNRGEGAPDQTGSEDPFAVFDSLISAKVKGKYDESKSKKDLDDAAVARAGEHAGSFNELAESGTYEQLEEANLPLYVRSAALELAVDVPKGFEDGMEKVGKAREAIKKFESLPDDMKSDERFVTAIEEIKAIAERVMRDWAQELHNWFAEIKERYQAGSESANEALQEIMSSPVFRAELEVGNESTEDFEKRVEQNLVDELAGTTEAQLQDLLTAKLGGVNGKMDCALAVADPKDGRRRSEAIRKFLRILTGERESGDDRTVGEVYSDIFDGSISTADTRRYGEKDEVQSTKDNKKINHDSDLRARLESVADNNSAIESITEGIRAFGEEKFRQMMDVIDEHVKDDDEKRKVLSFISTGGLKKVKTVDSPNEHSSVLYDLGLEAFGEEIPEWYMPVLRVYNEAQLFKLLVVSGTKAEDPEAFVHSARMNEILRLHAGEQISGEWQGEGAKPYLKNNGRYAQIRATWGDPKASAGQFDYKRHVDVSKVGLGDDLVLKAWATGDSIDRSKINFSTDGGKEWRSLDTKLLKRPDNLFRRGVDLQDGVDQKPVKAWQEEISARLEAHSPTTAEKLADELRRKGKIKVASLAEAQRFIDVLKGEVVKASATVNKVKAEAQEQVRQAEGATVEKQAELDRVNAELEARRVELRGIEEALAGAEGVSPADLSGSVAKQKRTTSEQADRIGQLSSSLDLEKQKVHVAETGKAASDRKIQEASAKLVSGLEQASQISGWGADKKRAQALEALLRQVQGELNKNNN